MEEGNINTPIIPYKVPEICEEVVRRVRMGGV